jgi:hypothetical protein
VADAAVDMPSVVLEERKLDFEVSGETEVAGLAGTQCGQLEDKQLTDQVVPGATPAQLGRTVRWGVKRSLALVLEPEQDLMEGVLLLRQKASRTVSHLSQGSNNIVAWCHQSAVSRAQRALGHQEQTEGPMNQQRWQRPPEQPCTLARVFSCLSPHCLPSYHNAIVLQISNRKKTKFPI